MSKVSGKIKAPEAIRTHSDLADVTVSGEIASGSETNLSLGTIQNTGNVPQTYVLAITNEVNCTVNRVAAGNSLADLPFTLQPGQSVPIYAAVKFAEVEAGAEPVTFSFDATPAWS